MNKLVKQSYDKFENKTITITECAGSTYPMKVQLHHYSSPQGDVDCIDVVYTQRGGQDPRLINGELILLINGSKRYTLEPKVNIPPTSWWEEEDILGSWPPDTRKVLYWKQDMYYQLPEGLLREMAYAENIEMKVTGASVDLVLKDREYPSLHLLTKVLYNTIYDSSAFADDIQQECGDHDNYEQICHELMGERDNIVKECEKICGNNSYIKDKIDYYLGFSYFNKKKFNEEKHYCIENEQFYNVLIYAIPKYEALLELRKKYKNNFPTYELPFEPKEIQEFINALKETRNEIEQKATRKKVIIGIVVAVVIIIIIAIAV